MTTAPRDLPTGTVTFLFTDVEGSTRLLHELGPSAYAETLAAHRRVIREAVAANDGVEVDTQGDAFFVAFPSAVGALAAALAARDALADGPIRVRMGLHTGAPLVTAEGYVGPDVHRAARIAAAGHGGQVLVSAATAGLIDHDGLLDLGEHRLKDLSAPERIFQVGDDAFPSLRSLYRTNLPIPLTPFLGRAREVGQVVDLLGRDGVRLVTLTGPGGTGKTRLSMEAAANASERYPDGVWWVPLAPLRDPRLVTETASRIVGSANGLADHIGDRSMLMVFDNFEQVVAAAADLSDVLAACPRLSLLVTSREPLHIGGEHEYPVPPLEANEGVELFVTRARAIEPAFEPDAAVDEICRQLDGLPLAIELAAARTRSLSPQQILERLEHRFALLTGGARDAPERQRTLRSAIEWSHDLLDDDERAAFRRLSVFRGGCTLDAAERIADADLDTLQSLIDKSLVRFVDGRYRMLETIREFAAERLEAAGETSERQERHAASYIEFAEAAFPHLKGDPKVWLDRLDADHDNLRAALDRLAAAGDTQRVLQLAGALWKFWYQRGHVPEGRRRLVAALEADDRPTAARARALNGAGGLTAEYGDVDAASRYDDEAIALYTALGDAEGIAVSRFMSAHSAMIRGEWAVAIGLLEPCLATFTELGDDHYALLTTDTLAWAYEELGDHVRAQGLSEDVLARARSAGNRRMEVNALHSLSYLARAGGRVADALSMVEAAHRINVDLGQRIEIVGDLSRLARILAAADRPLDAARLVGRSRALADEIGASRAYEQERDDDTLAIVRSRVDEPTLTEALDAGRAMTVEDAVALALGTAATDA